MESVDVLIADIGELRQDVDALYKTVYQGNGAPSLTNQVTQINERLDSLEEKIISNIETIDSEMSLKFDSITAIVNERFNNISLQISNEFERTKLKEAGSHQLRANLVSATIATITALAAIFLNHFITNIHR